MENKSKNRILAACVPRISMPAERGTLECSDATEDHFSPSSAWFGVAVGGGSGWRRGHLWCRLLLWLPSISPAELVFRFQPPTSASTFPPLFAPCPPARPPSSPRTLCARPTPPAPLQAGHSDKTVAGPLAKELAESISSQQTTEDPSRSQILLLWEANRETGAAHSENGEYETWKEASTVKTGGN